MAFAYSSNITDINLGAIQLSHLCPEQNDVSPQLVTVPTSIGGPKRSASPLLLEPARAFSAFLFNVDLLSLLHWPLQPVLKMAVEQSPNAVDNMIRPAAQDPNGLEFLSRSAK